jgi:hypothetical protein
VGSVQFECGLPGDLAVRCVDLTPFVGRAISRDLGTAPNPAEPRGRVTIQGVEGGRATSAPLESMLGDAGDGLVVGWTADGAVVVDDGARIELRGTSDDVLVRVGSDVDGWRLLRDVVRPAIQVAALGRGTVVAHAAAVEVDGTTVVIAGWSESGKTETALALVESGASFLGDKWTVLAHRSSAEPGDVIVGPFPNRVGVRRWVLPYLPRLATALGRPRHARLAAGAAVAAAAGRVRSATRGSRTLDAVIGPIGALAGLTDTVRLSPDAVRRAYGDDRPTSEPILGALILLDTIEAGGDAGIGRLDARSAAVAMARSAAYERRRYHLLGERLAGREPSIVPGFEIVAREADAIEALLANVATYRLRAPFPADPTIAAGLISSVL